MKMIPRRWRIRTMMVMVVVVAVGAKLVMKATEVTLAKKLQSFPMFLGLPIPKGTFTEAELISGLSDPTPWVRRSAVRVLDSMGSTSPAVVPELVAQIESETEEDLWQNRRDPSSKFDPVACLKRIKPSLAALVPRLVKPMASKNRLARLRTVEVLCDAATRSRPTDPLAARLLLGALGDDECRIRMRAAEVLAGLDQATRQKAATLLLKQLQTAKPPGMLEAVVALEGFDPEGTPAVKILSERLQKADLKERLTALFLLGRLGPMARPAVPEVVRAMTARDATKDVHGYLDPLNTPYSGQHSQWRSWREEKVLYSHSPPLPQSNLCVLGAVVLAQLGPDAEQEAIDELTKRLRSDDEPVRLRAVDALREFGPKAASALPDLIALTERKPSARGLDDEREPMTRIASALEKVGTATNVEVVAAMLRMLESEDLSTRWAAAERLAHLNPPPTAAVPALIKALGDPAQGVRFHAAIALGRYGEPERETS